MNTSPQPGNPSVPEESAKTARSDTGSSILEAKADNAKNGTVESQSGASVDMSGVAWKDAEKFPISDPRMARAYRNVGISFLVAFVLGSSIALVMFFTVPWSAYIELNLRARGETKMSMLTLLLMPLAVGLFYIVGMRDAHKIEKKTPERLISKRALVGSHIFLSLFAVFFFICRLYLRWGFCVVLGLLIGI